MMQDVDEGWPHSLDNSQGMICWNHIQDNMDGLQTEERSN